MHDFDAVGLFHLGKKLVVSPPLDEAVRRTAANRFYYAAFLVARRKAKLDHLTEKSHTLVRNYWKSQNIALWRRLSTLYAYREHADYTRDREFTAINLSDAQLTSEFILRKFAAIT